MAQTENFKDWLFRYQYLYGIRRSDKSKKRFIGALVADLAAMGAAPQVIEYDQQKKSASRNVYVGDLKRAKKVICTYYDTPPISIGDYVFFDRKRQSRQTVLAILMGSLVLLLLGGLGLAWLMSNSWFSLDFTRPLTYVSIVALLVFFLLLGRVTKGLANRRNLVRNTGSVLLLLSMIEANRNPFVAYAFIDEGTFGERGLEVLQSSLPKGTPVYFLEAVAAKAPLYIKDRETTLFSKEAVAAKTKDQVRYIFSGEPGTEGFTLSKKLLRSKEMNMENIEQLITALS